MCAASKHVVWHDDDYTFERKISVGGACHIITKLWKSRDIEFPHISASAYIYYLYIYKIHISIAVYR